jgi:tetratricopeptide (TPR) repeat protein
MTLCTTATLGANNETHHSYVPPELQASDPGVKNLLDSAAQSAKQGHYNEALTSLQKALELATKQRSAADKAVVESSLGVYYFSQGKLEDAKSQWIRALSDGTAASNLVL